MVREIMELEVAQLAGAELGERAPERRQAQRNGYRERRWDTRVGEIELQIPRLRTGSYVPSFLEPRRRAEQALVAVVQEAYVNGVSTQKVDRLVEQMGLRGLSKDQVSRMCRGLDEQVELFRARPLEGEYPYLWLDAKVAREVLGIDVGEAETEAFWTEFLFSRRPAGWSASGCASPTRIRAWSARSPVCWAAGGTGAPCTSSATCSVTAAAPSSR
jgi:putative transposase